MGFVYRNKPCGNSPRAKLWDPPAWQLSDLQLYSGHRGLWRRTHCPLVPAWSLPSGSPHTHTNQCETTFAQQKSLQTCVYHLQKSNLSSSDAGTYYCVVASCGKLLFGSGSELLIRRHAEERLSQTGIFLWLSVFRSGILLLFVMICVCIYIRKSQWVQCCMLGCVVLHSSHNWNQNKSFHLLLQFSFWNHVALFCLTQEFPLWVLLPLNTLFLFYLQHPEGKTVFNVASNHLSPEKSVSIFFLLLTKTLPKQLFKVYYCWVSGEVASKMYLTVTVVWIAAVL